MKYKMLLLILFTIGLFSPYVCRSIDYPHQNWELDRRGDSDTVLAALAEEIGGDGCVVLNGKILYSWGRVDRHRDWASASKPILSTLLFCALDRHLVRSVDDRLTDYGVLLKGKDTTITFRTLGAMTSGYVLCEAAGQAYAYNDYAIQLYKKTLFENVYKQTAQKTTEQQFRALNFEDSWSYYKMPPHKERISMSVRDYARLVWLWRNRGKWDKRRLVSRKLFRKYMRPPVPYGLPHAASCDSIDDYLGIGSYGGGADHFTRLGPGVYGFNWWFNRPLPQNGGQPLFPSLPGDLILALGVRGHLALFSPKRSYALITSFGCWGDIGTGWMPSHEALLGRFIQHMEKAYSR